VLACLLAGRPTLLLAPTLPEPLLDTVAGQAGCRHLVQAGPEGIASRLVEAAPWAGAVPPGTCVMLATSGSTGHPKVVAHQGAAVDRFIGWVAHQFAVGPGTSTLGVAALNFVVSLFDLWTTLARGGRVVLVDPARSTHPNYLADLLHRHRIDLVQAVPTMFRILAEATRPRPLRFDRVGHVVSTGDAVTADGLARLAEVFPGARLYNAYGCTETIGSFLHEATTVPPAGAPVPIGRPVPGIRAAIVADDGTTVVGSGRGELHVSSPFQAVGYLDPTQTAERFVVRRDGGEARCWFRTGDLAERDAEGRVRLVGRKDFEVKVRGVRINTQEVEQVLRGHPDVLEAAVVALPDDLAGHVLHAAVRPASDRRLDSMALRSHCARGLPRWAVPSAFRIGREPLPRTATGKLDRQAVAQLLCPPPRP
jgi:acyl-coenzyme A synthetase/AMP-(fatty) acid ligase